MAFSASTQAPSLHPLNRVLLVLGAALILPRASSPVLLTLLLLLCAVCAVNGRMCFLGLVRAVRRIRILLITIMVAYLAMPLINAETGPPLQYAVAIGVHQLLFLIVLVGLVEVLTFTTPPEVLAATLSRLLLPLRFVGVDPGRIALRIALTMRAVPEISEAVHDVLRSRPEGRRAWGEVAAELIRNVEKRAANRSQNSLQLPVLRAMSPLDAGALTAAGTILVLITRV